MCHIYPYCSINMAIYVWGTREGQRVIKERLLPALGDGWGVNSFGLVQTGLEFMTTFTPQRCLCLFTLPIILTNIEILTQKTQQKPKPKPPTAAICRMTLHILSFALGTCKIHYYCGQFNTREKNTVGKNMAARRYHEYKWSMQRTQWLTLFTIYK